MLKGIKKMVPPGVKRAIKSAISPLDSNEPAAKGKKAANKAGSSAVPAAQNAAEMPYGTKISQISREGIEFYWKKVEFATGYDIYRSYSEEGPFEHIGTNPKRILGEFLDSEFDRTKRKIYYTVRSYYDVDGERLYSEQTAPTVAEYREEIKLERLNTVLYSGATRAIRAFYGWGEVEDAVWSTDNPEVAVVDQEGVITAVSQGECKVICSSESIGAAVSANVIVDRKGPEPISEIKPRFVETEAGYWENPNAEKTQDAVLMMAGDMMCGNGQMRAYKTEDGWNFNKTFELFHPVTAKSDFAIGNLETLLAPGWPYMEDEVFIDNKNNCNVPPRYLDAICYGGFDGVVMSNNHNCDGGVKALMETIEQVNKYKLANTGVFRTADEKRFFIVDVNGIKVGFLSYMSGRTGFNGKENSWTPTEMSTHINVFNKKKAERDVEACRAAGAEYVIAYMHWGTKNFRNPTEDQRNLAQAAADAGVDYIVGSNPHVVQVYEEIMDKDGRMVPCFYSVGNFVSVMKQIEGNRDSVLVKLRLKRDESGRVYLAENTYIPCFCYTKVDDCKWAPVALSEGYNFSSKLGKKAFNRIVSCVGEGIEVCGRKNKKGSDKGGTGKNNNQSGESSMFKNLFKKKTSDSKVEAKPTETKKTEKKSSAPKKKVKVPAEDRIQSVMEKSGWDRETTVAAMMDAKRKYGYTYPTYDNYNIHLVPEEEMQAEYDRLETVKKIKNIQLDLRIKYVMKETGLDYDTIDQDIKRTFKEIGLGSLRYVNEGAYKIPFEERAEWWENVKAERIEGFRERNRGYMRLVAERNGWTIPDTRREIEAALEKYGVDYEEYCLYKFDELSDEERAKYVTVRDRIYYVNKYNVNKYFTQLIQNKAATDFYFSDCIRRAWCINTEISREDFIEKFADLKKIFYKPLSGMHGDGAQAIDINRDNAGEIYDRLSVCEEGVVEQFIVQHPKVTEISPHAVASVRVVSVSSTTRPVTTDGKMIDIVFCMLKMGGKDSIVDNLAGGGIGAAIDMETGKLCTNAVDIDGNFFEYHPGTGVKIKGYEVPHFDKVVEMVKNACKTKRIDGYIGWDVAIMEDGPELIEVNRSPGEILLQLPYVEDGKGMKYLYDRLI